MSTTKVSSLTLFILSIYVSFGFSIRADDFRVNDSIPPSEIDNFFVSTPFNGKYVIAWEDVSEFENRQIQ